MRSAWALTPVLAIGLGMGFDGPARPSVQSNDPPACLWNPAPKAGDREAWERSWKCGEKVSALIRGGDEAERERLWSVFDEMPEASPVRAMMIDAFLDAHLERALEDLEANPPPGAVVPMVDPPDDAVPDHLKPAPAELRQAWWLFQQAKGEAQRARPRPAKGEGISFQSHEPAFQNAVAGLLRGRVAPGEAVRELTRFEWGGWCGTGSDSFYMPQAKALMIAYLRLGRLDLATAASPGLASWMSRPDAVAPWDRRLLGAAGIEWERFYVGGVVSGEAGFADALARQGSDQAAQQLVAATRLMSVKEESAVDLVWPLAALVEQTRSCSDYATMSLREVDREPGAPSVSGSVQAEALELLAERVRLGAGLDEADAASHLLVRLCRPESREAFRTMLRSPYSEVRQRGAIGLRGLGETVPEPKASAAVVFRLLASGKPLAHQQVEWTLSSGAGSVSSSAETDAKGLLSLARDPLVDPRRPVTSIVLAGRQRGPSDGLRFEVTLAPPRDLDAVTTVSVRPGRP